MIPGGYVLQPRCIESSWVAHAAPVVRETWRYLIMNANHRDKKYDGFVVKKGQIFTSYQRIRDALSWKVGYRTKRYSENQMKHTMNLLRRHGMIDLSSQPRGNLITILKYNEYQNPKNYESTCESTHESTNDQPMINQTSTPINKNVKNVKNVKNTTFPHPDADCSEEKIYLTRRKKKLSGKRLDSFLIFWEAFDYKRDKASAADAWIDIPMLTDKLVGTICDAAKKEADRRQELIRSGRTPIYAQGWLSARRWEDEVEEGPRVLTDEEIEAKYANQHG